MPFFVRRLLATVARLARLVIAGLPHVLCQRVRHAEVMARDPQDRSSFVRRLREAADRHGVQVHAYGLSDTRFDLVVTPGEAVSLSRFVQVLARNHALDINRRHDRLGGLWEGRFRASPIEPDAWLLDCLRYVEQLPGHPPWGSHDRPSDRSSAGHHLGQDLLGWISDPPGYWALGNTPFEREAAYDKLLKHALTHERIERIEAALRGGWILGSSAFAAAQAQGRERSVLPRPRGRPRKQGSS